MSVSAQELLCKLLNNDRTTSSSPTSPDLLGSNVTMVTLVVYLHNYLLIPKVIPELVKKKKEHHPIPGIQFLTPQKVVRDTTSAQGILKDLKDNGYTLSTAEWEECLNDKHKKEPSYYKVRFNFYRSELLPEGFEEKKEFEEALKSILRAAFWSVRGYNNHFFKDQKETSQRMVSLNFNGRLPLCEEEEVFDSETQSMKLIVGEPIMVWPKNELGKPKKTGGKVPLAPAKRIEIVENKVRVVSSKT